MKSADIGNIRLLSQQVSDTKFMSVKELVGFMGAMQAQDYAMSKWAIGVRVAKSTEKMVETAIAKGEIIRTHLLRPTWHWVSADDIYWMLDLVGKHVLSSLKPRQRQLGLTDKVLAKNNKIIEHTLADGNHLTREELLPLLEKTGVEMNGEIATYLLVYAELSGLICSGAEKKGKQTYALLEERVPKPKAITREAALAVLAKRYFVSHGPATLQDFIWWSGLSITEGKKALEIVKNELVSEKMIDETYWFSSDMVLPKRYKKTVYLLPAFDEFIISYKDRTASLLSEHFKTAVSTNGIFRPVIVADGKVIGLWKRNVAKATVIVEPELFQPFENQTVLLIENAAKPFGKFLGKKPQLILP